MLTRSFACLSSTSSRQLVMTSFDLESYFRRINYDGETLPTLEVLNALTEAHVKSIPFENLDVVLNKPIELSDDAIFDKLVTKKRGGYCFEQNALLLRALEHLGFAAKPLSARVRLRFTTRDQMAPRTHMFVRVEIGKESFLTDVGMGSASLTSALKLVPDIEQATSHESRRIVKDGNLWFHQIRYGDIWQDACEFTLEEMPLIDREIANWFTSTHPRSHFRDRLVSAIALDKGQRLTLQNFEVTKRQRNGDAQKRQLQSNRELVDVLTNEFGLRLAANDSEHLLRVGLSEILK